MPTSDHAHIHKNSKDINVKEKYKGIKRNIGNKKSEKVSLSKT